MKNVIMMLVSEIIGVLILAIVMTVCGKMNRSVEVQSNLSSAMEMTVERMAKKEGTFQYTGETAVAECVECMAAAMDTDSDALLHVYQADAGKGILAMKLTEMFDHPNGMTGETEWERVAIYNKTEEPERRCYEVRFYKSKKDMLEEENCYKLYTIQEGAYVTAPMAPAEQGAVFIGWKDGNDYMADFSQSIEQNRSYYAGWETSSVENN